MQTTSKTVHDLDLSIQEPETIAGLGEHCGGNVDPMPATRRSAARSARASRSASSPSPDFDFAAPDVSSFLQGICTGIAIKRIRSSRDKAPFGYLVVGLALIPISFTSGGIAWLRVTLLALACVLMY